MDAAFGWLGKLMETLGDLIPRWKIVPITHGGVSFVRGKHVKIIRPGLYFYWPLWTDFIIIPVVRQTLNIEAQTLTTGDDVSVTVSAVIVYSISDVEAALTSQWDLEDTIGDVTQMAVRAYVQDHTYDRLRENDELVLEDTVRQRLAPYGVNVIQAGLNGFARTKVITVVGGGTYIGTEE